MRSRPQLRNSRPGEQRLRRAANSAERYAIKQYKFDRDPREPLLAFRRCLAHFAVDPNLVFFTTRFERATTRFFPFNQGKYGGAGNPPVPPTDSRYAASYLWDRIWATAGRITRKRG